MKHPDSRLGSRPTAHHFALGLACASLTGACSGYYPLGDSRTDQLLDDSVTSGSVGDTHVGASLAPPDVTFGIDDYHTHVVSVGDVDGDGRDDVAHPTYDHQLGVGYVHLRYGGPRPVDAEDVFEFAEGGLRLTAGPLVPPELKVAGAGDVDADGYDDLLIQTFECSQPGSGAYLIYGGPERLEGTHSVPSVAAARFVPGGSGRCTNPLPPNRPGDLDGDGVDDLVIDGAAPSATDASFTEEEESTYLFYGRARRFSGELPLDAADARFHAATSTTALAAGDINADGLDDLLVAAPDDDGSFFLPGRTERWTGSVELASSATLLEGAYIHQEWRDTTRIAGDIDGDGSNDILLRGDDSDMTLYLFYGAPGLFDDGFALSRADATLQSDERRRTVFPIGDRDGDGDDELIDWFEISDDTRWRFAPNGAFSSGSPRRLSGVFSFPESEVIAEAPHGLFPNALSVFIIPPAGDLDGDGAADLFTAARYLDEVGVQLHIHYGTPAGQTVPVTPVR